MADGRSSESGIAYVFGGPLNVAPIRFFVNRHARRFTLEEYTEWENNPLATCVRAVADPQSDSPTLVGILFISFQKHHLRVEHVLVPEKYRRQRIATNLFYRLVVDPRSQQFQTISAFCADNCDEGIGWLVSCGFRAISVLPTKNPYTPSGERDHYLFSWSFSQLVKPFGDERAESDERVFGGSSRSRRSFRTRRLDDPDSDLCSGR